MDFVTMKKNIYIGCCGVGKILDGNETMFMK